MRGQVDESAKNVVDLVSVATVVGTVVDMLPSIAALFTIIWTGIRIWETQTVQNFFRRKKPENAE